MGEIIKMQDVHKVIGAMISRLDNPTFNSKYVHFVQGWSLLKITIFLKYNSNYTSKFYVSDSIHGLLYNLFYCVVLP